MASAAPRTRLACAGRKWDNAGGSFFVQKQGEVWATDGALLAHYIHSSLGSFAVCVLSTGGRVNYKNPPKKTCKWSDRKAELWKPVSKQLKLKITGCVYVCVCTHIQTHTYSCERKIFKIVTRKSFWVGQRKTKMLSLVVNKAGKGWKRRPEIFF